MSYRIICKTPLDTLGDYKLGLFNIISEENGRKIIIPVKIGISNTFLQIWGRGGGAAWGNTLVDLGSLQAELMYLENNVKDFVFKTYDFPEQYHLGEEGYQLLVDYLQKQIYDRHQIQRKTNS